MKAREGRWTFTGTGAMCFRKVALVARKKKKKFSQYSFSQKFLAFPLQYPGKDEHDPSGSEKPLGDGHGIYIQGGANVTEAFRMAITL